MDWITEGVIAGLVTTLIAFLGVKFRKVFANIPAAIKYLNFFLEAVQAAKVALNAIQDSKITKEEVAAVKKEVHEAIDAGMDAFDKKKGDYSELN